jgi:hypothetical protein
LLRCELRSILPSKVLKMSEELNKDHKDEQALEVDAGQTQSEGIRIISKLACGKFVDSS